MRSMVWLSNQSAVWPATDFTGSPVNHLQGILEVIKEFGIGIVLGDGPLFFVHCVDIGGKVAFLPAFAQFSFQFNDNTHGFIGVLKE